MWCGAAMSSIFCCTDAVSQVVESPKKFSKSQCRERFGTTAQIYVGIQAHFGENMSSVRKGGRQGPYRSIVEVLSWPMSNDLYLSVHCRHRGNVQKAKNPVQPTENQNRRRLFHSFSSIDAPAFLCASADASKLATSQKGPWPPTYTFYNRDWWKNGTNAATRSPSVFSTSFAKAPQSNAAVLCCCWPQVFC